MRLRNKEEKNAQHTTPAWAQLDGLFVKVQGRDVRTVQATGRCKKKQGENTDPKNENTKRKAMKGKKGCGRKETVFNGAG